MGRRTSDRCSRSRWRGVHCRRCRRGTSSTSHPHLRAERARGDWSQLVETKRKLLQGTFKLSPAWALTEALSIDACVHLLACRVRVPQPEHMANLVHRRALEIVAIEARLKDEELHDGGHDQADDLKREGERAPLGRLFVDVICNTQGSGNGSVASA